MRILVVSDTHGNYALLTQVIKAAGPIDLLLHAGDSGKDLDNLTRDFPALSLMAVAGNCDPFSSLPRERLFNLAGYKIFLTHGDRYRVKWDLLRLFLAGQERQAGVVVFGHTHVPLIRYEQGILFFNPGSLYRNNTGEAPSYGWLEIGADGVRPRLEFIEEKRKKG
ncbi:MAG: metallophosphoesterase [Firmicutes bacterium]|nr:metallophosphoesterase [Bacillota bacterium]